MNLSKFSGQIFQNFLHLLLKIRSVEYYNEFIRVYSFDVGSAKLVVVAQIIIKNKKKGKKQGGLGKF